LIENKLFISKSTETSQDMNLEYLFNKYYSRLCYYAYKLIKNQDAAKDLVQNVFLSYWEKRKEHSSEIAIKNFLYLSLRNACLNFIRHDLVEKKYAESLPDNILIEEKGLEYLIKAEAIAAIQNAIKQLPEGCKTVLKLAYFEGLKNDEIATELGISINTVKTQRQRALNLLRSRLSNSAFLLLLILLGS
jgi:RNA polymerase sigma-70 factor (family 1)